MFLPAHANTYVFLPTFPLPDPRLWDLEGSSCSSLGHGCYLCNMAAGWRLGCLVLRSLDKKDAVSIFWFLQEPCPGVSLHVSARSSVKPWNKL